MWDVVRELIGGDYAPHGYCLLWQPWLIWTMAISDLLIAAAYFSIPIALVTIVYKRRDIVFGAMFWLFAAFILACGLTHVVSLWNLWNGAYAIEAIVKAITALVSVVTAAMLWPLLPRAIALPSPALLREANEALRAEIAEREKAEAALLQSRKMEAMGQLTGGIAHDFNNLLQVISGSLDIIAARTRDDARVQHIASGALGAVERGRRLTGQLLSFARKQRMELKPVQLTNLVGDLKELLTRTIEPSIELRFDSIDLAETVFADPIQLELALLNLALNARDAMPDGGVLTISTATHPLTGRDDVDDGEYIGITVTDTGTGMTEDILARVFEPFFTTKSVGHGSGLGLSMVFGMTRQSGGTVTIDSRPGAGTSVTIYLQRIEGVPSDHVQPRRAAPGQLRQLGGIKILLVDDEHAVREVIAEMLEDMGCTVLSAESGERALQIMETEIPDAAVLDFAMPGMNGAEVAKAALARRPDLRIVFATGFAQSAAIDAAVGADAILIRKPFSPSTLVQALERAMAD